MIRRPGLERPQVRTLVLDVPAVERIVAVLDRVRLLQRRVASAEDGLAEIDEAVLRVVDLYQRHVDGLVHLRLHKLQEHDAVGLVESRDEVRVPLRHQALDVDVDARVRLQPVPVGIVEMYESVALFTDARVFPPSCQRDRFSKSYLKILGKCFQLPGERRLTREDILPYVLDLLHCADATELGVVDVFSHFQRN